MTVKLQQNLDQSKKDELNARKIKELIKLEEDVKKVQIQNDGLAGRQSGMYISYYAFL